MGLTMATRKELSKEVARRYQKARRGERMDILDEFCQSIGYNRHYAASILRNLGRPVYWRSPTGEQTVVIIGEQRIKKQRQAKPKIYDDIDQAWNIPNRCARLPDELHFIQIIHSRMFSEV
jgi:hypothetical protein